MEFSSNIHSRDGQRIQGWTLGMSLDPHPHMLDIHGVWPDRSGNRGYLVSTRLDTDLTQCVPNASELTTTMRGVLDALTYLHKHSIVHGDVKAGNIFLSFARDNAGKKTSVISNVVLGDPEGLFRIPDWIHHTTFQLARRRDLLAWSYCFMDKMLYAEGFTFKQVDAFRKLHEAIATNNDQEWALDGRLKDWVFDVYKFMER